MHSVADPFGALWQAPSLAQFKLLYDDPFYLKIILQTLGLSLGVTMLTLVLGYPLAMWLVGLPPQWRALGFAVILIPLLTNVVVRSLGIALLLAPEGLINQVLGWAGIMPFRTMLYTPGAVAIALTQVFMPFMVLALYDVLQGVSPRIHEAAASLGASPSARFLAVTLPLSLPGLRAGVIIVFLMSSTAYVSATLLGGQKVLTVGMLIWQEALQNLNAPLASALALVMACIGALMAFLTHRACAMMMPWAAQATGTSSTTALPAGLMAVLDTLGPLVYRFLVGAALLLLLLPLALVCIQSFNDVPQATVAGFRSFTFKWYAAVLGGSTYRAAFMTSLWVALAASAVALVLALPAAFAMARYRFRGLPILAAFWTMPLSMPQVALGVGMLKMLQINNVVPPFLGLMAVHVVIILPFAMALLQSSVEQLDRAQEEAAGSLGASPIKSLILVVLPGLAPGLVCAGVMGFLISFGEVTVSSFLTTARMTTPPVRIYADASFSLEPTVHAVSALMIAATLGALLLINRVVRLDRLYSR